MRQSEEPRQDAHRNRIRALPAVDRINRLPFLLLDKGHESVHVTRAGIATKLAVCDVKDGRQSRDEETSRQAWIFTKT